MFQQKRTDPDSLQYNLPMSHQRSEYNTVPHFNHIDLYRIEKGSELEELGLWDHIGYDTVSVIEWAEKVEHGLPDDTVRVRFRSLGDNMREITIKGKNEKNWNNL